MADIELLLSRNPVRNIGNQEFPDYVEHALGSATCVLLAELAKRDFSDLAVPIEVPCKGHVSVERFFGGIDADSPSDIQSMGEHEERWLNKWWPLAFTPSFDEFILFINFDRNVGSIWVSSNSLEADIMEGDDDSGVDYLCKDLNSFFDLIRPIEECPL